LLPSPRAFDENPRVGDAPFAFLRRRTLLKLGVAGLVAAGGGGAGLYALRGSAPAVDGLRILTAHQFRTLTSIASVQVPDADAQALGRVFDAFVADEPKENQRDLATALGLVEYGPVFFERRLTTFSNLDADARLAHWSGWTTSDLALRRQVAAAFRKFLMLVTFDTPQAWADIGYPGPSLLGVPR
jgi:hypothetical protein